MRPVFTGHMADELREDYKIVMNRGGATPSTPPARKPGRLARGDRENGTRLVPGSGVLFRL